MTYEQKLARVLDVMGGLYTVQDLLGAIGDGRMQSFAVGNTWAITQVTQFPRARRLQVVAMVGDLADGEAMHAKVIEYADRVNAGLIQAYGRLGWLPNARAHGWRVKAKSWLYQKDM